MTGRDRLLATGVIVALYAVALASGLVVYGKAADEVLSGERELFSTLLRLRRAQVSVYLNTMIEETRFWAQNRIMRQALREFSSAWEELGDGAQSQLQRLYVTGNPFPRGERDNLERADDESAYSEVHQLYHYWLRSFLLHRGVYDVFLFDRTGDLVYSSFKEADYATNVVDGPYRDTDLGRAFREARDNPFPSFVALYDFASYGPSDGAPAMFTASPVLADDGKLVGVIAFQIPPDGINRIVREVGMRETGKTFLLGPDLKLRSRTRFSETDTMLATSVDTETARLALAGEEGQRIARDYRDVPVLSTFSPLRVDRIQWAILSELDEWEYRAAASAIRNRMLVVSLGAATLASLGVLLAFRAASSPGVRAT